MTLYVKYLTALLLFGSNCIAVSHMTLLSSQIVLLRTGLGSALLVFIYLARGGHFQIRTAKKDYRWLLCSGMTMGLSWIFLYEAYGYLGINTASLCMYSALVLVMISAPLLFKERVSGTKLVGFLLALTGMVIINGAAFKEQLSLYGLFLGALSCLAYGTMIITGKLVRSVQGLKKSTVQVLASFLLTLAYTAAKGVLPFAISTAQLPWILSLGLLNTGVGCYLYFSSIGSIPAQTVAIFDNLELLSAILSATLILKEPMTGFQASGMVLILAGSVVGSINFKKKSYLPCHPSSEVHP